MTISGWKIDPHQNIAKHRSGLEVEIQGNQVIDILHLPESIQSDELPGLLKAAGNAYMNADPSHLTPRKKTNRPVLCLKR